MRRELDRRVTEKIGMASFPALQNRFHLGSSACVELQRVIDGLASADLEKFSQNPSNLARGDLNELKSVAVGKLSARTRQELSKTISNREDLQGVYANTAYMNRHVRLAENNIAEIRAMVDEMNNAADGIEGQISSTANAANRRYLTETLASLKGYAQDLSGMADSLERALKEAQTFDNTITKFDWIEEIQGCSASIRYHAKGTKDAALDIPSLLDDGERGEVNDHLEDIIKKLVYADGWSKRCANWGERAKQMHKVERLMKALVDLPDSPDVQANEIELDDL